MSEQKPFRWLNDREQAAWRAYLAASWRLQQKLDRELQRQSRMPHAYYQILAMLSESPEGGIRMSELAELVSMSPSRLSHAIRKLQELGLIRKDADPDDGRASYACLTTAGRDAIVSAAPGHVDTVVASVFDRLTPEQVEQLHEISLAMLGDETTAD